MRAPNWFWGAILLDLVLLAFGLYMAVSAAQIAIRTDGAFPALAIALLFAVLPVFCIVTPFAAWRAMTRKRSRAQIVVLFAAPWVYALFLVMFLFIS
jgi:hypothetical protein